MNEEDIEEQESVNGYNKDKKLNGPQLLTGMTPVKFITPTNEEMGYAVETNANDEGWYDYGTTPETKKWANTQTEDGSMWVWIPRYAYKITYYTDDPNDPNKNAEVTGNVTQYGKIDVKFLIGKTDSYYDDNGEIKEAQRAKTANEEINTTEDYTVHPVFTDESSIGFYNGGWDEELTGIWVAKFEAGYASANNNAPVKASSVNYENKNNNKVYVPAIENPAGTQDYLDARNWLDGIYGDETTAIKYPTFQPLTYSMNYICPSDAFKISKALTESENIYGLSSVDADSHLMKNSEWGAVAYLTKSKYGRNGEQITSNNGNLNSGDRARTETAGKSEVDSAYVVTGIVARSKASGQNLITQTQIDKVVNGEATNVNGSYLWNQVNGQKGSTTGTIYGIYDLGGGLNEMEAGFISNGNVNLYRYGQAVIDSAGVTYTENATHTSARVNANTGTSSKYVTIYRPHSDKENAGTNSSDSERSQANFTAFTGNSHMYGDSIRETTTSNAGTNNSGWTTSSWDKEASVFPEGSIMFFVRGGSWAHAGYNKVHFFYRFVGYPYYNTGFRTVLVNSVEH